MTIKINNKYLLKSLNDFIALLDKKENGIERQLIIQYRKSLQQIKFEISRLYERFGNEIENKSISYGRLVNMQNDILKNIKRILKDQHGFDSELTKTTLGDFYSRTYENTLSSVKSAVETNVNFGHVSDAIVRASIKNPLDKIGWGKRSVKNINSLNESIKTEITQGLIRGKSYAQTAHKINEAMNIGLNKSVRIVRTETHRVINQARSESFQSIKERVGKIGLEVLKVWDASNDSRTRITHKQMDGKIANEKGKFNFHGKMVDGPGMVGDPNEDINCRCVIRYELKGYSPK